MRRYPHRLLLAFGFCFLNLGLVTWRWRLLLKARAQQSIGLGRLFLVNWIGMFFSVVLPGSITGDVVKVFYVRKLDPELSTAFVVFCTLLDRVMGLTGLILMMGGFSLWNHGPLEQLSPRLTPLLRFNFLMLACVVVGLAVYFAKPGLLQKIFASLALRFPRMTLFKRTASLWEDLAAIRPQMAKAILASILVQFTSVVIFYLLVSPQFQTPLPLTVVLSFIPLGFMAVAIPISPAGLGVGHAAFQALFAFAGEPNGANFFNMYFVVTVCFNLLGVIPWLAARSRVETTAV